MLLKSTKGLVTVCVAILLSLPLTASADWNDDDTELPVDSMYQISYQPEEFGKIKVEKSIDFLGMKSDLYPEFTDEDLAVSKLKESYVEVFEYLRLEYDLPILTADSFYDYYYSFLDSASEPDSKYYYEHSLFNSITTFKDIFENKDSNNEIEYILDEINSNNLRDASLSDLALRTSGLDETSVSDEVLHLYYLMPLTSYLVEQGDKLEGIIAKANSRDTNIVVPMGLSTGAITKAVNYATKYAESYNTPMYAYYPGSDCTNFTSQILEAAGVSQVKHTSEHSGWWHTRSTVNTSYPPGYSYTHDHSVSWIRASTFARYMGVGPGRGPSQYKQFTQLAASGDFIGVDKGGDGDIDHTGFITAKGAPDNKGVYDLRIAQHTINYNAWTSSAINGWENIKEGEKYYFIRS